MNLCKNCDILEEQIALKQKEIVAFHKNQDEYVEKLEKEVGYWKEKALNFKKFHL
jgi:hypothetical protein